MKIGLVVNVYYHTQARPELTVDIAVVSWDA